LLVPAKLASSGYAEPLRQRLASTTQIARAAALEDASAFAAAVYPMALVAARAEPHGSSRTSSALGPRSKAPSLPQRELAARGPWILKTDAAAVARRLRAT